MPVATPIPEPVPIGATLSSSLASRLVPGLHAAFRNIHNIRYDVVAAITLAAYLLPSNLGDATLAGLPPEAGLYSCIFSGLLFWMFCSSRHTAVTVTSAISLLIGSSLGELANGDAARFWALASCTAILVSLLSFIAWIVHAGVLVDFISETVMTGFKAGVAIYLTSTQLPKLFGFHGSHGNCWERFGYFAVHLHETNWVSLALGATAVAILFAEKVFLKNKPVALFVMAAGILVASLAPINKWGVALLGDIPNGLPVVQMPAVEWHDLDDLLPLAMACFLLAAVESAAIGRMFSVKYRYRININQEFLALAAANLAAGFGRGYPVAGGMSQSLVNESAGARTPLSGFIAAVLVLLVTVFLSGLVRNLPQPVLAAIVLAAVASLLKVSALKRLWRFNRVEFAVAMAALLGVLGAGLLRGVLIGAILSLLVLLRRGSRPHTAELGRVPGSSYFADLKRHKENERIPGVFVFRVDSSLLYFNVDHVRDRFMTLLNQRTDDVRLVVFFLGTTPMIDIAGADLIHELYEITRSRNMIFRLAEVHGDVRDSLRRAGLGEYAESIQANQTVAEIISAFLPTP